MIALRRRRVDEMDWKPHQGYLLSAHDRMTVSATRAGLGRVLARSAPGVCQPFGACAGRIESYYLDTAPQLLAELLSNQAFRRFC